jgi:4-hydroxy-3-methylbut-2-enyl diphosphate reductase IspH
MVYIIGPHRSGKTTKLIQLAREKNAAIIVGNFMKKEKVYKCAKALNIDDITCFTIREIKNGRHKRLDIRVFVIDDIESLIQEIFPGIPVIAVSGTSGRYPENICEKINEGLLEILKENKCVLNAIGLVM